MSFLDTIRKAKSYDGLEKQYLANQVKDQTTKANMEELSRFIAPYRDAYSNQLLNQNVNSLAAEGIEKIPYHDGMSVPDSIKLEQLIRAEDRQINRDESTIKNVDWSNPQVKDAIGRIDNRVYNSLAAEGYR